MFKKKKTQQKEEDLSVRFGKGMKKAGDVLKKDVAVAKQVIEEDIKKLETPGTVNFFITYGWAILVIIVCVIGFMWWQFFSINSESCEFTEGTGLLCQNFDVTNESFSIEIRNLNNETIIINQIMFKSCSINPERDIPDNDRRVFSIPCNSSSGRLRKKVVVAYTVDDFKKHAIAKISKIVP